MSKLQHRLPEDDRILIAEHPADFFWFQQRKKYGINGIVYTPAYDPDLRQAARNYGLEFMRSVSGSTGTERVACLKRKDRLYHPEKTENLLKSIFALEAQPALARFIATACQCHAIAFPDAFSDYNNESHLKIDLRVNSTYPSFYHGGPFDNHMPVIAASANQPGLEFRNLSGTPVRVPAATIALIDETVIHRASQVDPEILLADPRVNFII